MIIINFIKLYYNFTNKFLLKKQIEEIWVNITGNSIKFKNSVNYFQRKY